MHSSRLKIISITLIASLEFDNIRPRYTVSTNFNLTHPSFTRKGQQDNRMVIMSSDIKSYKLLNSRDKWQN